MMVACQLLHGTTWHVATRRNIDDIIHSSNPHACRYADPGYTAGDPEDDDAPDPLQAALSSKEAYQHIRALPAEPGSAVIFTHR